MCFQVLELLFPIYWNWNSKSAKKKSFLQQFFFNHRLSEGWTLYSSTMLILPSRVIYNSRMFFYLAFLCRFLPSAEGIYLLYNELKLNQDLVNSLRNILFGVLTFHIFFIALCEISLSQQWNFIWMLKGSFCFQQFICWRGNALCLLGRLLFEMAWHEPLINLYLQHFEMVSKTSV